jgi:hypothetical protein
MNGLPRLIAVPRVENCSARTVWQGESALQTTFDCAQSPRARSTPRRAHHGGPTGERLGKEAAEFATAFPPIWTEIEMTICADGDWTHQLIQHSILPSGSYYAINEPGVFERQGKSYDAVPNLEKWKQDGWGPMIPGRGGHTPGNPWKMTSPKGWGGSTTSNIPASNGSASAR